MGWRLLNCEPGLKDVSHRWQIMVWDAGNVVGNGERQPEHRWANSRNGEMKVVRAGECGRASPRLLNFAKSEKELGRTRERQ